MLVTARQHSAPYLFGATEDRTMSRLILLAIAGALILGSLTVVSEAYDTRSMDLSSVGAYDASEIPLFTNAI